MDISADEVQVSWSSPADGVATTYTLPPNSTLDSSYLSTPCGSGKTAKPPATLCCVTSPIARLVTAAQHGIPVARARVTQGETQLQVVPASLLRRSSRQRVHNAVGVTIRGQKGGPLLALAPAAVDGLGTK